MPFGPNFRNLTFGEPSSGFTPGPRSASPHVYLNFLNKGNDPFECKCQIVSTTLRFVDAGENVIMADDVATPLNPLVALVKQEELEETPFDVNVSQWPCEEKPSRKVVCTQVDCLTRDHRLFPNPHALAIYLEFVPTRRATPKRFKECQCQCLFSLSNLGSR